MNLTWVELMQSIVLVGGLLLLIGVFAACETGLLRLRYMRGNEADQEKIRQHKATASLLDNAERTAVCLRFNMTLATIALGLALLPILNTGSENTWVTFFTFVAAFVLASGAHAVLADMIPRILASHTPNLFVQRTAWLVLVASWITWPIIWTLEKSVFSFLGIFNVQPVTRRINLMDAEVQIRALGEEDTSLSPELRRIILSVLRLRDLEVSDVLLPRNQVQYMDLNDGVESNLTLARQAGHTRYPLCAGDLDQCIGIIHIKDIFRHPGSDKSIDLRKLKRETTSVSQNEPLEVSLKKLLRGNMHMALVHDEFGGSVGVITLERILEEFVGEIRDEFDSHEEEYHVEPVGDAYEIPGLTPIHQVEEALSISIENEEVSTFGGLITYELGIIPEQGQQIVLPEAGLEVVIDEVDERRIIATTVRLVRTSDDEERS